jgi:hypothetical protein
VLTRTFPPELVDRVTTRTGQAEQRQWLPPARVVIYYTLAMCLFAQAGYEEVMRLLVEGLAWMRRWHGAWRVPNKSSIARARARLGPHRCGSCSSRSPGRWRPQRYQGRGIGIGGWWRWTARPWTHPIPPANVAAFGRPGGAGPRRVPAGAAGGLVECGTHAVADAAVGGLHLGEGSLAPSLARSLQRRMLLLADQGLCGLWLWRSFQATGAELVWRCRQHVKLEVLEVFADGSWRSQLGAGHARAKRVAVRVVDYRLDDPGHPGGPDGYRLIATIADPTRAPAAELGALYASGGIGGSAGMS